MQPDLAMPLPVPAPPAYDARASLNAINPPLVALLRAVRELVAHGTPVPLLRYDLHLPPLVQAARTQRLHGSAHVMDLLRVGLERRLRDASTLSLHEVSVLATWPAVWITEVLGCGEPSPRAEAPSAVLARLQGLDWFPVLPLPFAARLQGWLAQDRSRFATAARSHDSWPDAEPPPLLQVDFAAVASPVGAAPLRAPGLQ